MTANHIIYPFYLSIEWGLIALMVFSIWNMNENVVRSKMLGVLHCATCGKFKAPV